jgi:anti-sigma factor RsiW
MNGSGNQGPEWDEKDLDWLAERFVLAELPAAEEEAVASRLPDDDALAAAVARAGRLVTLVRAATLESPPADTRPAPRLQLDGKQARWLFLAASAVAAAMAWVTWVAPPPRPERPSALPGSAAVVAIWRNDDAPVTFDGELSGYDAIVAEPDTVTDWMLAAITLDATDGESEVLEN